MKRPHGLERENEALRDRRDRLSEASLRITEDLDFNSVLQGVLDSARALTGARYGVVVLHNATPILSDEGTVESMVVTLQDMADVEELERLRAEFLAMVSHENERWPEAGNVRVNQLQGILG